MPEKCIIVGSGLTCLPNVALQRSLPTRIQDLFAKLQNVAAAHVYRDTNGMYAMLLLVANQGRHPARQAESYSVATLLRTR